MSSCPSCPMCPRVLMFCVSSCPMCLTCLTYPTCLSYPTCLACLTRPGGSTCFSCLACPAVLHVLIRNVFHGFTYIRALLALESYLPYCPCLSYIPYVGMRALCILRASRVLAVLLTLNKNTLRFLVRSVKREQK